MRGFYYTAFRATSECFRFCMIRRNSALLYEVLEESNERQRDFRRSIAGRFQQDFSLGRATRAKEAQDRRAVHLADLDERNHRQRRRCQQRGDSNSSSCPGLMLNVAIEDAARKAHIKRSRSPATSASLVVPLSSNSRSSPRLSRPISSLKRLPATTVATKSPRKPASPRKENRQTAIERAVRVYTHSPGVDASSGCRPQSPRLAGSTSPRGSLPPWKEMRGPASERRRCTAAEERRHPPPWPLPDGRFGGQVVPMSASSHHGEMGPREEAGYVAAQSRRLPMRPPTRCSGPCKRFSRPTGARAVWREEEVGNPGEPRVDVAYRAREEQGWASTDRRVVAGSPLMRGTVATSTQQPRSPLRGVRRQLIRGEAPPAAQRARALELQMLATEREELEAQLAEVKRLMRASNLENMCWKATATGISGDGSPRTQARIVQRGKRKRRLSTAPLTNVARDTSDQYPTMRRGFGAHCPPGGNERSAWVEHSAEEAAGYPSAGGIARRRRSKSGERGGREMRSRQHVLRTTYERVVPERERATVMLGASSYSSTDRTASAGGVKDCPRRRIVRENIAATVQRPQASTRRPTATSHPPLPKHPIEHQIMEMAATTVRGKEGGILHGQDFPHFRTSERHSRETRNSPGYTIDGFTAGEGRLKGGHWERSNHEPRASSPSRDGGNSPPSAWVDNDGRTSSAVQGLGRKFVKKKRVFPTPDLIWDREGNAGEEIDNYYEDDFKVASARGSYVFVPWDHTFVPKRADGIGSPMSPREGRQHLRHDCRQSRAAVSHHEGAEGALSCQNSSDNLWGNDLIVDMDNVLDHSDNWSDGRGARSTQGGGASSWREWNRSDENGSVFQAWDKVIHKARGHRNGHVFEHLWIEYGKTSTATSADTRPDRFVASQGHVGNTTSASHGNLSAGRVASQLSIHRESKDEKRCSGDEDGKVPAPQSEGGSSLYDVLLSDGSNSDEAWSMGSLDQNESAEALNARETGGASALNRPSGLSAQQRSSPRSRLGGVSMGRKVPALVSSSSEGSSLYNIFYHASHASDSNQRAIVNDPSVPFPPPRREEKQQDVVLHGYMGNSTDLTASGSEDVPARSPSDTQVVRPEGHAQQTTAESLAHVRQHARVKQEGNIGVRGAFDERSRDTPTKRLSQPGMRSTDDKGSSHEILFNKRKLDEETTTENDGGRWTKDHGGASQKTVESKQHFKPLPFVAKPRQRRLDRRRSTGDGELENQALARHAAARSMGHRAGSLGSLAIEHIQRYFDESLQRGRTRMGSLRDEGLANDFRSLDQQAGEGSGAGSSVRNHGRAVEEQKAEQARLIDDSGLEGKKAQAPVGEDRPVDAAISADKGFVRSCSRDIKGRYNIEGKEKAEALSHGDEPSRVGRDKSLVDERPPAGEMPASKNSDDCGRGPDIRGDHFVDQAPGDNLSPHQIQRQQLLAKGSRLEEDTALARSLSAVGAGIRYTEREVENNGSFDETTVNDAQHKQTLARLGYVEMGAREGGVGATESPGSEGELKHDIGSLDGLSTQHEPHRALIDEGSFDERGRSLKELPSVVETASASGQGLTDRTESGDGRIAEPMLDRKDAFAASDAPRQEADDQSNLIAEIVAKIVTEIVAVDGERGDYEGGGRRGVNEDEFKNNEAFDEAPLEGRPPPELLDGASADGRPLIDRPPVECSFAQQLLDSELNHGVVPEEPVAGNAEVDESSTYHELLVDLLTKEKSPPDESEENNVGVGETISSATGKGGVVTDGNLDVDTPLDGKTLVAGEVLNAPSVVDVTQTQPRGDGDLFDESAGGRASGSKHDSAETKHSQPDGEGSLDEYLFDAESSGNHSLDRSSFDGQSLSDHNSENESSLGESLPSTGSTDDVSAMDDDLLFDDA